MFSANTGAPRQSPPAKPSYPPAPSASPLRYAHQVLQRHRHEIRRLLRITRQANRRRNRLHRRGLWATRIAAMPVHCPRRPSCKQPQSVSHTGAGPSATSSHLEHLVHAFPHAPSHLRRRLGSAPEQFSRRSAPWEVRQMWPISHVRPTFSPLGLSYQRRCFCGASESAHVSPALDVDHWSCHRRPG